MAEAVEADGQGQKVECCSRRGASELMNGIIANIKDVIGSNEDINDSEKCRVAEKFETIYSTIFTRNIQIDGQSWEDVENGSDDTSEFEPIDLKKSRYINEDLVAVVDDAVIKTTKKRQICPFTIKQNTSKYVNANVLQQTKFKVSCTSTCTAGVMEESQRLTTDSVKERVGVTGETLSSLTKSLPEEIARAERHGSAIKIFKSNKNSKTQHVLLNNSFMQNDKSLTPLKRKTSNPKATTEGTSKRLRFSNRKKQKHDYQESIKNKKLTVLSCSNRLS